MLRKPEGADPLTPIEREAMKTVTQWRPFADECLHCGDGAEVFTDSGADNLAYDGDEARCIGCGCPGRVNVDAGYTDGASIDWHEYGGRDCCAWCRVQVGPFFGDGIEHHNVRNFVQ